MSGSPEGARARLLPWAGRKESQTPILPTRLFPPPRRPLSVSPFPYPGCPWSERDVTPVQSPVPTVFSVSLSPLRRGHVPGCSRL